MAKDGTENAVRVLAADEEENIQLQVKWRFKKTGQGLKYDDKIYSMLQEIVTDSINEFKNGYGDRIEISVNYTSGDMSVRDYGRGLPVGELEPHYMWISSSLWPKDDRNRFFLAITGSKEVNALSARFCARSVRDGEYEEIVLEGKRLTSHVRGKCGADEKNGMFVRWIPDTAMLHDFTVVEKHVVRRIKECAEANPGLKFS